MGEATKDTQGNTKDAGDDTADTASTTNDTEDNTCDTGGEYRVYRPECKGFTRSDIERKRVIRWEYEGMQERVQKDTEEHTENTEDDTKDTEENTKEIT